MTQAVAKQNNQQQVQQQHAAADQIHEQSASASASAGLNLNLFAALSGAFSSKSKKTTRQSANGDVVTDEERLDQGAAKGIAQGQGRAFAKADASQREVKAAKKRVDHLGIEG